jgi:hypothetical protein
MERRSSVRYELRVPVLFSWDNAQAGPRQAGGFTRDLSTVGAYVICEQATDCPAVHSTVAVHLLLPPLETGAPAIPLNTDEARVVRAGSKTEDTGFAIVADFGANFPEPEGMSAGSSGAG